MIPPIAIAVVIRPNPTSVMPSRSCAYSTSTDQAAPNVTLNATIVIAQRAHRRVVGEPAQALGHLVRASARRSPDGRVVRLRVHDAGDQQRAEARTRRRRRRTAGPSRSANRSGPDRRREQLVGEQHAAREPGVGDAQVLAPDEPRQDALAADVGERLGRPEHEQRDEHDRDADAAGDDRRREEREDGARTRLTDGHEPDAVDPVGHDARRERRTAAPAGSGRARAIETSNGSRVWLATSSGPAASAIPSPMLVRTDATSSRRNQRPSRGGAIRSAATAG